MHASAKNKAAVFEAMSYGSRTQHPSASRTRRGRGRGRGGAYSPHVMHQPEATEEPPAGLTGDGDEGGDSYRAGEGGTGARGTGGGARERRLQR